LELQGCSNELLGDEKRLQEILRKAAEASAAKVYGEVSRSFMPSGVSCIILVAESHISIHTWIEFSYAAVDIFTCGDIDPKKACEVIIAELRPEKTRKIELERGPI
jgi:S-adenosylmethionine decarboxylase proenzyme